MQGVILAALKDNGHGLNIVQSRKDRNGHSWADSSLGDWMFALARCVLDKPSLRDDVFGRGARAVDKIRALIDTDMMKRRDKVKGKVETTEFVSAWAEQEQFVDVQDSKGGADDDGGDSDNEEEDVKIQCPISKCMSVGFGNNNALRAHLRKYHPQVGAKYLKQETTVDTDTKRLRIVDNQQERVKILCLMCRGKKEILRVRMKEHIQVVHKLGPFGRGEKVSHCAR